MKNPINPNMKPCGLVELKEDQLIDVTGGYEDKVLAAGVNGPIVIRVSEAYDVTRAFFALLGRPAW